MFEHLATPIAYAVGLFFTFYMIAAIFMFKMDSNAQTYCDNAVHEFVDDARAAGYISPSAYRELIEALNRTGNLYDVTVCHESAVIYTDGSTVASAYNAHYNNEILEVLYPSSGSDSNYTMKTGDYLKVSYSEKSQSGLSLILSKFVIHGKSSSISGSYGGYVGSSGDL